MKFLIILLLLIATNVYADELQIPFSVFPKKIQSKFAENGLKLDLSPNDRSKESWGFIENKGTCFSIFTYEPLIKNDFILIQKLVMEN